MCETKKTIQMGGYFVDPFLDRFKAKLPELMLVSLRKNLNENKVSSKDMVDINTMIELIEPHNESIFEEVINLIKQERSLNILTESSLNKFGIRTRIFGASSLRQLQYIRAKYWSDIYPGVKNEYKHLNIDAEQTYFEQFCIDESTSDEGIDTFFDDLLSVD